MIQKIILSGCNGRMGRVLQQLCAADSQVEVVAGFDLLGQGDGSFPIFSQPSECTVPADMVIDFSTPSALNALLAYGISHQIPLVLATTGYGPEQVASIQEAASQIPIFRSANMSLGINVLLALVQKAAAVLGDSYDIEIVERHHSKKVDAPSGTALMLANAAQSALSFQPEYVYERQSVRQARAHSEIGISSVRGGTIVGDHEVIFAGRDEIIEIKHHAASREIFANGALHAAKFLQGKPPGLYDMSALISEI